MQEVECYQILRVDEQASLEEIKQAYRRGVQLYHPDVRPWDKNSGERFKRIAQAYRVLSEKKRPKKPENTPSNNILAAVFSFSRKPIFSSLEAPSAVPVSNNSWQAQLSTIELALRFWGTENAFVRREVIKALRYKKDREALKVLTKALKISDYEVRRLAVQSLSYFLEPQVVYFIASMLEDSDIRVRYEAIEALGVYGGERAEAILKRLTFNGSFFMRERAQRALISLRTKNFKNSKRT